MGLSTCHFRIHSSVAPYDSPIHFCVIPGRFLINPITTPSACALHLFSTSLAAVHGFSSTVSQRFPWCVHHIIWLCSSSIEFDSSNLEIGSGIIQALHLNCKAQKTDGFVSRGAGKAVAETRAFYGMSERELCSLVWDT